MNKSNANIRAASLLLLGVVGSAAGILVVGTLADLSVQELSVSGHTLEVWKNGANRALDGLPEVLSAVLGISLTVVAIVVQLAAQRYPAKIVDVFMFDRLNIATFAFMAASCVYVVMATASNVGGNLPWVAFIALALTIVNFALLLPYFAHVFAFLEPTNLISEIKGRSWSGLERLTREEVDHARIAQVQVRTASALDRIADNCMAAIGQFDRNLAVHSVQTMEGMLCDYMGLKANMPGPWKVVDHRFFGTLAHESVADLVQQGTWFEAKGFMEFERIIRQAFDEMSEVVSQIARSTGAVGAAAIAAGEFASVELAIRFFNTYIRHGLNRKNIRAVYNILYEYRTLAIGLLKTRPDLALRAVEHLVYYGRTANEMGLPFVTVTVAHDVRVICESAFEVTDADMETMLDLFLKLDQPVEGKGEEVALIGVRKAQSILGAFLLRAGSEALANKIRHDMRSERPDRLRHIRDEILAVKERKFWEITDRGFNFDYAAPDTHPSIQKFFEPMVGG